MEFDLVAEYREQLAIANERIAELKAWNERLRQPVTAAEFKEFSHKDDWGVECVYLSGCNHIIAARLSASKAISDACRLDASRNGAERDTLKNALVGLLARHCDGTPEQYWGEWDTAQEALQEGK